jgi:hypothetical protein
MAREIWEIKMPTFIDISGIIYKYCGKIQGWDMDEVTETKEL